MIDLNEGLDYRLPIEIAKGIFWIGFADDNAGLHCNPYLIVDGDEAVLIDGGSRGDFSTVMMKILQTGIDPNQIQRLIYQHYDPDLCGSIPHFEKLIKNDDLKIISHRENNIFIEYYASTRPKECIENLGYTYTFKSGRELQFIKTPYAHSPGSFMTYDTESKILFSSDIFGSYDHIWNLYLELREECQKCNMPRTCVQTNDHCPIYGIIDFHKRIMTSSKALKYALDAITKVEINLVAPQHGSLISGSEWRELVMKKLYQTEDVGIDWVLKGVAYEEEN
jgi:flavorubredoxin